jgi:hypothetical protein
MLGVGVPRLKHSAICLAHRPTLKSEFFHCQFFNPQAPLKIAQRLTVVQIRVLRTFFSILNFELCCVAKPYVDDRFRVRHEF